jgi:hypothetical protein
MLRQRDDAIFGFAKYPVFLLRQNECPVRGEE